MTMLAEIAAVVAVLAGGSYLVALLDGVLTRAGSAPRDMLLGPLRRAAQELLRQSVVTERPDRVASYAAPALYLALAAVGLSVVPLSERLVTVDVDGGIVVWGAVEALTIVAVFLHGWAPNSQLPLMGAYRYVGIALPAMLLSMFVLIGAALPAESLNVSRIVESQAELWNVLRQPLGLPLFLLLGLTMTLRGPLDYADSADLAGGTSAEAAGIDYALWQLARSTMLVAFAAMGSAAFLGGHLGPVLPGPVWLLGKTAAVLALLVAVSHSFARFDASRMLTGLWTVLLPLAFLDLLIAGLVALP